MKPGLFLAAALFGVLSASVASSQSLPATSIVEEKDEIAKRIDQRVAFLTEKLDLNESQQANAEECLRAASEKFKEIRDDATLPDAQKRSLWGSSRKAYRNYLRSLLTDEQKDIFDALLISLAADREKERAKADKAAGKANDAEAEAESAKKDPFLDDLGAAPAF